MRVDKIERLTHDEMWSKYPNQWFGIRNMKYKNNDGVNVESAEVVYAGESKSELLERQLIGGEDIICWPTFTNSSMIGGFDIYKPADEE